MVIIVFKSNESITKTVSYIYLCSLTEPVISHAHAKYTNVTVSCFGQKYLIKITYINKL